MTQGKTWQTLGIIFVLLSIYITLPQTYALETTTPSPPPIPQNTPQHISLQHLINTAEAHTTLYLPSGVYQEILLINKPLTITGNNTILAPTSPENGYAIHITAADVHLTNIQIQNYATGLYSTAVKISAPRTTISNSTFSDTPIGIALWSSSNIITNCSFYHCQDEGIVLLGTADDPCTNNTITHSSFLENCDGIELQHASHNHITNSSFQRNTHAGIDAIEADNNHNIISNCTFSNNTVFGVYLAQSTQNILSHCIFTNDILTMVHASDNFLQHSQIQRIQLLNESTLTLDDCIETPADHITTDHSSYEIQPTFQGHQNMKNEPSLSRYHQIIINILSHLKTFKTYLERLAEARM